MNETKASNLSSLEMMTAMLLISESNVVTDVTYVHGSPVQSPELDYQMLLEASKHFQSGRSGGIAIAGTSDALCREKNIAYAGWDTWTKTLRNQLGYSGPIHQIAPSLHTAEECKNLIERASQLGWKSITVMSLPHHILRCMLQIVYLLNERRSAFELKCYPKTIPYPCWHMTARKPVLRGVPIVGQLFDHIAAEHDRIVKYMDRNSKDFTPHATLSELIDYIRKRDGY